MIELVGFLTLMIVGYLAGQWNERRHYRSILRREEAFRRIPAIAYRHPPAELDGAPPKTQLVTGSVVISVDYFKRFVAVLSSLLGGRILAYESLLDRARREAILRMKDQARRKGARMVFNVKLETASIASGANNGPITVEVLAYGTALIPARPG